MVIIPKPTHTPLACAPYGSSPYYEYAYLPSLAPGIVFLGIFFLIACTQAFYLFRFRAWWMFLLVAGAGLECLGWIGRTVSHYCPYSGVMNEMQTSVLIMGPAWTQAGVYFAMWVLIQLIGAWVSPIKPSTYLWISWAVDSVCLSLQAIGGGLAGSAASEYKDPQTGTTIMVVGIIAQLVCGCIFWVYSCWIYHRGRKELCENKDAALAAAAMLFSTTMMNLRGFYRSVELVQGWRGYLISHEKYLIGLDAVPMVLAMGVLAILSPGPLLVNQRRNGIEREKQIARNRPVSEGGQSDDSERTISAITHRSDGKDAE